MPEYRRMLIAGFTNRVSGLVLNRVGLPGLSIERARVFQVRRNDCQLFGKLTHSASTSSPP